MRHDGVLRKHNSGIYVTDIPTNPFSNLAAIDFNAAESRGYFKLDILNVSVYQEIKDYAHYQQLLDTPPPWGRLREREFFSKILHIGNHYETLLKMPEPLDSDVRLMMFLAIIRPGKRHLIGKTWKEVAETVWDKSDSDGYVFKKSHSCAYARLVMMHMNLLHLKDVSQE